MPPTDTSPQGTIRYLARLLAIVIKQQGGGELRIRKSAMRKISEESFRIFEDFDDRRDELVLRFDSKHSAIYPVEAECRDTAQPEARTAQTPTLAPTPAMSPPKSPPSLPPSTAPGSTLPFTDEQLARAERKIVQMRNLHRIRRENAQS